jgi:hypothetical protein
MSADHDAPRQRFRDLKPYEVVDSLDDLQGPAAGSVHLPRWVRWQADGEVDIDDPGGLRMAYQALLSEGTSEIQAQLLNRRLLTIVWPTLNLDNRVRDLWEGRFVELRSVHAQ